MPKIICIIDKVIINISGNHLKSNQRTIAYDISAGEISNYDVKRITEESLIRFSNQDDEVIQSLAVDYAIDDMRHIKNPCLMTGRKLTAYLNIVTISATAHKNLLKALTNCHLNVSYIVPSAYAAAFANLTLEEKEQGVLMIDIGEGNSDLAIFFQGKLQFITSLPIGGKLITNDISPLWLNL